MIEAPRIDGSSARPQILDTNEAKKKKKSRKASSTDGFYLFSRSRTLQRFFFFLFITTFRNRILRFDNIEADKEITGL